MTQTLVNRDRARGRIRDTVRRRGSGWVKAVTASGTIACMVVAAVLPDHLWDTLSAGGSVRTLVVGALAKLLPEAGTDVITTFLVDALERLRKQKRLPETEDGLQQELERQLLAALQANDEQAAQLRVDAAAILEHVQGVEAALEAATGDLRQALAEAFAEYGSSFAEFRWMLDETRQTLTAIQQEQAPGRGAAPPDRARPRDPGQDQPDPAAAGGPRRRPAPPRPRPPRPARRRRTGPPPPPATGALPGPGGVPGGGPLPAAHLPAVAGGLSPSYSGVT